MHLSVRIQWECDPNRKKQYEPRVTNNFAADMVDSAVVFIAIYKMTYIWKVKYDQNNINNHVQKYYY